MKYDVSMHLPSQVEGLMLAFQKADVPFLERCLNNIVNLVKDDKFQKDIKEYQERRMKKIEELTSKALDAARTVKDAKSFSELYVDVEEIKNDLVSSIDLVEQDYWDHIKEYVTLYLHEETKADNDEI